ncbi:MAG: TRAP transporter small permease [Rhodospirillales bacterium]|nr:TRAP transporter small permease [Rhodospirillales bacterium]
MAKIIRRAVDLILDGLCTVTLASIVLVAMFQVGNRFLLHYPIGWTGEIARYLAVWVVLLGAARCVREDSHIQIDLLFNLMNPRTQWWLSLLVNTIFMALVCVLVWQGIKILPLVSKQTAAASRISMAWVYLAVPFSSAIIGFYLVEKFIALFRVSRNFGQGQNQEADHV